MAEITPASCLELIEAIVAEPASTQVVRHYTIKLAALPTGQDILNLNLSDQRVLLMFMIEWTKDLTQIEHHPDWNTQIQQHQNAIRQQYAEQIEEHFPGLGQGLISIAAAAGVSQSQEPAYQIGFQGVLSAILHLLNRKLPYQENDILALLNHLLGHNLFTRWGWPTPELTSGALKALGYYLQDHQPSEALVATVEAVIQRLREHPTEYRQHVAKFHALIQAETQNLPLIATDVWASTAIQDIQQLDADTRSLWLRLLTQCATATGGKPSNKWLKAAQPILVQLGWDRFKQSLLAWVPLVDQPRPQPPTPPSRWTPNPNLLMDENVDILRGLVWLCAQQEDPDLATALVQLAISAYRKLPGIGSRCVRLGNACVWALGQMPGQTGIAKLAILKLKVKFGSAQNGIENALSAAAERIGLARSEIEELSVLSYGLETVGLRREILGDFVAELRVTGTHSTELRWLKADGKPQKSVPKVVKDHFPEALKELKKATKDIQAMLPAQRDRIESLYLQQRTWDFATWKDRYLDHPLIGTLARRLIWHFQDEDHDLEGIWLDGQVVNRNDEPLTWICDRTQVQLWHPITASPATIQAWRDWFLAHEIQQPFKQAHRELYVLTPAEEETHLYSNRFAAHIIKQHQFNALCGQRGWKNQLRLMFDDTYPPTSFPLPQWGLRAEFWVEGIGDEYGTDTNDTGTYLYLATDQVRFYPLASTQAAAHPPGSGYDRYQMLGEPVPLTEVPALVFTEVMRDVDLFVGVASVGNDPTWIDGGTERPQVQLNYWQDYSFGELSENAKTRRAVLEQLIPRLKIRDRCHFQDKFLVVRGDLRTYKIHLGSGNILMEPNHQYLCIVPDRKQTGMPSQVFLPFEGDTMTSVILSKALLLAEDQTIQDPTILRQIQLMD